MKLLLIKIGKAVTAIKRDGFFKAGKRIIAAAFGMFRRVGSGDILFITSGATGDSTRYRVWHVAEELGLHGFKCSITIQDNPWLASYADKFKIFIFHRTLYTPKVAKLIQKIKDQKKEIIFETDDLLFNPEYFAQSDYAKQINALEKKLYENGLGAEILKDPYIKVCTATTSYLADKLKEYNKKVFIVQNKLSNRDLEIADGIIREPRTKSQQLIRIGYFSGTISHNRDFATITDALLKIMDKYGNVELFLVGPLDIENKLNKFGGRIKQLPYVPRDKHFKNIAGVDINLAPLEIGNPYCEAKSELKFFEAGILGVPTVAAATRTFQEAIFDGLDGFLAANDEWEEKLERLILDQVLRKKMGERARTKSLQKYTNKNSANEEYYDYLKSKLSQAE